MTSPVFKHAAAHCYLPNGLEWGMWDRIFSHGFVQRKSLSEVKEKNMLDTYNNGFIELLGHSKGG